MAAAIVGRSMLMSIETTVVNANTGAMSRTAKGALAREQLAPQKIHIKAVVIPKIHAIKALAAMRTASSSRGVARQNARVLKESAAAEHGTTSR